MSCERVKGINCHGKNNVTLTITEPFSSTEIDACFLDTLWIRMTMSQVSDLRKNRSEAFYKAEITR